MRIIDRTRESMGWNNPFQTRNQNQIRRIGIHHSATADGNMRIFENHWRTLGWRNGGYHEIILRNGDVELCYVPTTVANGVRGHNPDSYHICTVGNSNFTTSQEHSLIERIRHNMGRFTIPIERVLGHNEFPNQATACPGRNMSILRNQMRLPQTAPSNRVHVVRAGETLSRLAVQYQTTVAELQRLNNITNANLIRVGQILRLPEANVANQATPNSNRHHVGRATQGFMTAADAANGRNPRVTVRPGTYYVFNHSQGMINVTTRQNIPGSWINPNR